jgi:arylsulfatase A-like enzyme
VIPSVERAPAEETPRVPFVVHAPVLGIHGVVSDVDYQHIDFGETLADVLDLPPPADGGGVSAFSDRRPDRDKTFENRGARFAYSEDEGWQLIQ